MTAALVRAGATPAQASDQVAALMASRGIAPKPDDIELGANDEAPAVGLFLALDTQWQFAGMGGMRTGLNYTAIEPTARLRGIELTPGVMADLQIMEQEALRIFAERAIREARK